MAQEVKAATTAAATTAPDENDYRSFCAALSESARGRSFLAEYARRNRHADTEVLLAALDRMEALMRAEGTALDRLRDELRLLLIAIKLSRPEIDAASPLTKAAKLAGLVEMLEQRIDAITEKKTEELARPLDAAADEIARTLLSVVPISDEPELPIPSPAAVAAPAIALVQELAQEEARAPEESRTQDLLQTQDLLAVAAIPEVTFVETTPPPLRKVEPAAVAAAPAAAPAEKPKRTDMLAAIMAMSEAERIALFT